MNTVTQLPPLKQKSQIPGVTKNMDGDHLAKPSRLEQMRAEYQRKLMREKEQKLIELYENNQRKALEKVHRPQQNAGPALPGNGNSGGSAQKMWAPAQREYSSSTIISQASYRTANSAGSDFHLRHNAGRDRSKPLAPLDRKQSADTQSGNYPPVPTKPRIPRHRGSARSVVSTASVKDHQSVYSQASAPVYGSHRNPDQELSSGSSTDSTPPPNLAQLRNLQRQRINKQRQAKTDYNSEPSPSQSEKKMTEFQRWQMEQDRARADRLKRNRAQNGRNHSVGSDVDKENSSSSELALQQKQLMDAIHQREAELLKIQQDRLREEEEEEARKERARRKRMEAAEQEKLRKKREEEALQMQMEEERRERERQVRQEEEDMQQQQHVQTTEQRRAAERDRMRQRAAEKQEKQRAAAAAAGRRRRDSEESKQGTQSNHRRAPSLDRRSSMDRRSSLDQSWDEASGSSQMAHAKRTQRQERAVKRQPSPPAASSSMAEDLQFYMEAAIQEDAHGSVGSMAPCKICGRRFAEDRIARHQAACGNAHKKRKVLDPSKMRTSGTEMEKYVKNGITPREPPRRNSDWRAKRNDFINAIRYAKKVTQIEKEGGNLASLPPPPPSENPDYVQCPHCSRRFNPSTAERHIPKCKNTRARPAPPRRR